MQRTQIYFEQETLQELKNIAEHHKISVSEFIRGAVQQEIKKQKSANIDEFIKTMPPIESFADIDAEEYVKTMRQKSRILNEQNTLGQ